MSFRIIYGYGVRSVVVMRMCFGFDSLHYIISSFHSIPASYANIPLPTVIKRVCKFLLGTPPVSLVIIYGKYFLLCTPQSISNLRYMNTNTNVHMKMMRKTPIIKNENISLRFEPFTISSSDE